MAVGAYILLILGLFILLLVVFLLGPRAKVDLFWNTKRVRIKLAGAPAQLTTSDLKALREQVLAHELAIPGVVDGGEKAIVFSSESRPKRTKFVVLYVHGFSACRQEISPVPETIAASLHANYYGVRLTGHGLDGEALANAKPNDWLFDMAEAWTVATALGDHVIVISTSTGGTLSTWLAQQPDVKPQLAAMIMVSPNFQPAHWATPMFLWPWSTYWLPLLSGGTHGWEPSNDGGAKYWTYQYPVRAVHLMAALVRSVRKSDVESITAPTLFLYSDDDKIVKARYTDAIMRRWGAAIKHRIAIPGKADDNNHVVTGDIVRPETTDQFISDILVFLKQHVVKSIGD